MRHHLKKNIVAFAYYLLLAGIIISIITASAIFIWLKKEPAVGATRGRYMGEWVFNNFHSKLLSEAMRSCYLGEKNYKETYAEISDLNERYMSGNIGSKQLKREASALLEKFLDTVQNKKSDCIATSQISQRVRQIREKELDIAGKYYSGYNRWEIYFEKVMIWLYYHIYVDNATPFEVPNI